MRYKFEATFQRWRNVSCRNHVGAILNNAADVWKALRDGDAVDAVGPANVDKQSFPDSCPVIAFDHIFTLVPWFHREKCHGVCEPLGPSGILRKFDKHRIRRIVREAEARLGRLLRAWPLHHSIHSPRRGAPHLLTDLVDAAVEQRIGERLGRRRVRHNPFPRLLEDPIQHGEPQEPLGVVLGEATRTGDLCERRLAADGERACHPKPGDGVEAEQGALLFAQVSVDGCECAPRSTQALTASLALFMRNGIGPCTSALSSSIASRSAS